MSKIAISGASTGTATFTIESPATSTNRTLTLPDNTGTILTSGTAATSIPGYGNLTEADQWYLTADITGPATGTISSNLSRLTTGAAGYLGTGMSESSGIFTFPSTGYWLVQFSFLASNISAGSGDRVAVYVSATLNNSSYVFIAEAGASLDGTAANAQGGGSAQAIIDVTDTANVKVRFQVQSFAATSVLLGDANRLRTGFSFVRLGDT
jgi:hypothetical protein